MAVTQVPHTLQDIRNKVRRITGRPSQNQLSDDDIDNYINTFYLYDMSEHLKMESLRFNYQFTTTANIPVYDMPTDIYLTSMPPVYIGGYQSYMTQSRDNFFRINPSLNLLQQSVATGTGIPTVYTGVLTQTPIIPGFKPNPPGAYSANNVSVSSINWNVMFSTLGVPSGTSGISPSLTLVDDGKGNLYNVFDPANPQSSPNFSGPAPIVRGNINYITGAFSITTFADANNAAVNVPAGNAINAQYIPYVASRPQSVVFYQDQFILYPIPDQAYTVSFEAYKYPSAFLNDPSGIGNPQLNEWWQLLAFGAAQKVFEDNGDFENMMKFRPLLDEQMRLALRRTIVQQTSERSATIYTEQAAPPQYPFGNLFSGF